MRDEMDKITIYIVVIAIFFLILFLSISAPMIINESDFSIYNPGWNGCSHLGVKTRDMGNFAQNIEIGEGEQTEVTQRELTGYDMEPEKTGLMIIGPRQEFSGEEIEFVDEFLKDGGKMVLADDFGSGNDLLNGLETNSSFHSSPLLDLAFEKKPEFGVAYNITEHNMTDDVNNVMLNSPTAINKDANATTIMRSSDASWLDIDENRKKDEDESFKKYPLMTTEKYGEGELILVSDPSIFINSMQDRKDNGVLSENVLDYLSEGRSNIIFDESHREMSFLYRIIYAGNLPNIIIGSLLLFSGISIGMYFGFSETKDLLFKNVRKILSYLTDEEEEKEEIGKVLNKHPDWDKDKLEMINDKFNKS